jgi:MFS family permease
MTVSEQNLHSDEATYCEVHPDRETALRCNKCGRLMCVECAVRTPVGYRCRECVRQQEDRFYSATAVDYVITFVVCAVLGYLGGLLLGLVRFILLAFILAAPIGGAIGEVALRLTRRRRGRYSGLIGAAATAIGALFPLIAVFLSTGRLVPDLTLIIYAVVAAVSVYGRFMLRI